MQTMMRVYESQKSAKIDTKINNARMLQRIPKFKRKKKKMKTNQVHRTVSINTYTCISAIKKQQE